MFTLSAYLVGNDQVIYFSNHNLNNQFGETEFSMPFTQIEKTFKGLTTIDELYIYLGDVFCEYCERCCCFGCTQSMRACV